MGCDYEEIFENCEIVISIHAPIVGCDTNAFSVLIITLDFNPRTHRGVRQGWILFHSKRQTISIHAPIVGCDHAKHWTGNRWKYFNPRTHRGVRHDKCRKRSQDVYFNPRTHRGVRPIMYQSQLFTSKISIHAPIVGCDYDWILPSAIIKLFQSTHPSWGATIQSLVKHYSRFYFNPRTHRGVRPSLI